METTEPQTTVERYPIVPRPIRLDVIDKLGIV